MTEPAATELGVGKALAEARQAQGLTLADVAQQLKFMPRQIESLEAERFEALPGPTIARGMVRTYARFLKIDPEPLLQSMTGRVDAPDATPQLAARFNQPVPFSDNGRRSTALYLALSAGVLVIAGGLVYEWRHERDAAPSAATPAPAKQAAAERKAARIQAPSAPAAAVAPIPQPAPPPQAAVPPVPLLPAAPKEAPPPKVASAEPAAPKSAAAAAPKPSEATPAKAAESAAPKAAGPNRLVLRFEQDAWAEVTDAAGRNLISSLNAAGTERVVRGTPPFSLVIGNAQHVKVTYNSREVDLQPYVNVEVARFTIK